MDDRGIASGQFCGLTCLPVLCSVCVWYLCAFISQPNSRLNSAQHLSRPIISEMTVRNFRDWASDWAELRVTSCRLTFIHAKFGKFCFHNSKQFKWIHGGRFNLNNCNLFRYVHRVQHHYHWNRRLCPLWSIKCYMPRCLVEMLSSV